MIIRERTDGWRLAGGSAASRGRHRFINPRVKRQARSCWKPSESVRSFGLSWAICSPRYTDVRSRSTALLLALLLAARDACGVVRE